jgi:hypothetical protein
MASRPSMFVQVSSTNGLIDVEDARVGVGALWTPGATAITARSGFRPPFSDAGAVTATGTPNGFVHVSPFQLILQSVRAADGGPYVMTLDATKDINVLSTPANATNPRDDLIIAQQNDTYYADADSNWDVRQIVGTPAGSPSDPAVTGSSDYIVLARVRVGAAATTISPGNITDLRTSGHAKSLTGGLWTVAAGGVLPVASATQQAAVVGNYDGKMLWRQDYGALFGNNGSSYRQVTPYRPAPQVLTSAAASVVFSGIPTDLKTVTVRWSCRGDTAATTTNMQMRLNGASTTDYFGNTAQVQNTTAANGTFIGTTSAQHGSIFAATSGANQFTVGEVVIPGWDLHAASTPHAKINGFGRFACYDTAANSFVGQFGFLYNVGGPYTSITLFPLAGNFVAGSSFTLEGI